MAEVGSRLRLGVAILVAALAVALFAKRDHDQQQRLDVLAKEMTALRADVQRVQAPVSPPVQLSAGACTLDSEAIEAIAARLAALTARGANEVTRGSEDPLPQPGPDQSLARANEVVDDAIRRGHLTREDVVEIRGQLARSQQPDGAQELAKRIAVAINTNKLVADDPDFTMP